MAFKVLTSFVFLLIFAGSGYACMYGSPYPSVCDLYAESETVIIGKVKKLVTTTEKNSRGDDDDVQTATIEVVKLFKGANAKQIVVRKVITPCGFKFDEKEAVGKRYLFYLFRNVETKKLVIYEADPFESSAKALIWLNGLPRSLNRTRLSGEIEQHDSKAYEFDFVKYIVGAKVRIFNEKNTFDVLTDQKGRYELWDVPIGKYKIKPEYPSDLILRFSMTYGAVEFRQIDEDRTDSEDFTVEAKPGMCGGANFIVDTKENLK